MVVYKFLSSHNLIVELNTFIHEAAEAIADLCIQAGKNVLEIYNSPFSYSQKEDKSPITEADKISHSVICRGLSNITQSYLGYSLPILSEEGSSIPFKERSSWDFYWLIDPLDGTKEFIKKNGEFTINIALIKKNTPFAGFIYAPVLDELFYGIPDLGAFKISGCLNKSPLSLKNHAIPISPPHKEESSSATIRIISSKSHLNDATRDFIDGLKNCFTFVDIISAGSSLKFCRVAEGKADIYPRLGPTMEWDTAAGHCICTIAGCRVVDLLTGEEPVYNKKDLHNGEFAVCSVSKPGVLALTPGRTEADTPCPPAGA